MESRYIDSRNATQQRKRQVVGRGIRTPDANCAIYILDERHIKFEQFLPDCFQGNWIEGDRDSFVLTKVERDPAIRRTALKHYGFKCHACDLELEPDVPRLQVLQVCPSSFDKTSRMLATSHSFSIKPW